MTDEELRALTEVRFPGGMYEVAHWENFLLTDCTGREPMADDLGQMVLNRTWRPQLAVVGMDGYPVGYVQGSHVHRLSGEYVGELYKDAGAEGAMAGAIRAASMKYAVSQDHVAEGIEKLVALGSKVVAAFKTLPPVISTPASKVNQDLEAEMEAAGVKWQMSIFGGLLHSFCEVESDVPGIACFDPGAARQCYRMIDDFATAAFEGKL